VSVLRRIEDNVSCITGRISDHRNKLWVYNVHGSVHRKNILIYVQQDSTLHSLFIWKLLYMFRVVPPPIIRSANNYLQHLVFVTPLLLPVAIAAVSSNGLI
jgi:hypothetical protein